jgi:hypothetical protein
VIWDHDFLSLCPEIMGTVIPGFILYFIGLNIKFSTNAQWEALKTEVLGSELPLGG